MKSKKGRKPSLPPASQTSNPVKARPVSPSVSLLDRINQLSATYRYRILGGLILFWLILRVAQFNSVAHSTLFQLYNWKESDSYFFDEQARTLAAGDWLNRQPLHPYHGWHQAFADQYFQRHPEKLNQILAANPGRDSSFLPGKVLWNEWYGGNVYHQEPLYAYVLAGLYALTGNGVYWMMILQALLGIGSGGLLWSIARRYFGDAVALLTGVLYGFCGIVLFQEVLLLRTSWSVFFALLTVWTLQRALDRGTMPSFFVAGLSIGFAYLLQSYFILFLLGALILYWLQQRKPIRLFARNAGLMAGGFAIVILPVILRNAAVGAPLFSISSTGAVTFVVTNVQHTNAVSRWEPDAVRCAEIMGNAGGKFMLAAGGALQSHSVGSYVRLLWSKFQSILNGQEWPNNENYYFYKATVPVLALSFLNFYWIGWLGIAGMLFAWYYRKKAGPLSLGMLLQLALLLGFYVLGRLRAPLVVMMLPFASYCLVECLRFAQSTRREMLGKFAVAALCFLLFSYSFYRYRLNMLDQTDYNVLYEIAYFEQIKQRAESKQLKEAISLHTDFLSYQPDFITTIKPNQLLASAPEIELLDYFANHHQIHSDLHEDSGNKDMAAREQMKFEMMKKVVENSRRKFGK